MSHGGGGKNSSAGPCIPFNEELKIKAAIRNFEESEEAPLFPPPPAGLEKYAFYPQAGKLWEDLFPNNFVDLASGSGIRDYNDTRYTYNGHQGIDSDLCTFTEQGIGVPVYAVLPGVVTAAHDGEFDMHTSQVSGAPANYVVVNHGGTYETWYYHLKNGSVQVTVGQTVKAGQQLGLTASSGFSTGPHLHFESRHNGAHFEPFTGPQNPGTSHWVNQPAFRSEMYVRDFNLSSQDLSGWAGPPVDTPRSGTFTTGVKQVYFWGIFQSLPASSTYRVRFIRPNGTVAHNYGTTGFGDGAEPFYKWSWWWWWYEADFNVAGDWTLEFSVNGTVAVQAPIRVTNGAATNRPPGNITAAFDPPVADAANVIFCRVPFRLIDDPDYNVVRYRYQWRRNGTIVRDSTNAALGDAIPSDTCINGDLLTCTVTPMDGVASGNPVVATMTVGPAPVPEIAVEQPTGTDLADGSATADLGEVGTGSTSVRTFTIRNIGSAALNSLAISKDGANAGDFTVSSLSATSLAPGGSQTFTVTFSPTAEGTRTAAIHISSTDADENPFDISLAGSGIPGPEIVMEQPVGTNLTDGVSTVSFGSTTVGIATTQVFRIKNIGTVNLTGLNITFDGAHAADFSVTASPTAPVAGSGVFTSFTVRFLPSGTGVRTAALHIASNDGDENPFDIALTGTGAADPVAVPAPSIATPAANALFNLTAAQQVTVSGTATDNKAVKRVLVSLNGAPYVDATLSAPNTPSTGYAFPVTPTGGANTIVVKTIDHADQGSPEVIRTFRVARLLLVTVSPSNQGTVTAGFEGTSFREVGKSLSISAAVKLPVGALQPPIFMGWTLGGQDAAMGNIPFTPQRLGMAASALSKPTITLVFREGLTLTANFISSPFYSVAGTYNGLVETESADADISANSTEGFFTATVQNTGAFSGKVTIDGVVLTVAGAFDHDGVARFGTARQTTFTLVRTGKPSLILSLSGLLTHPRSISGTVTQTAFQRSSIVAVSGIEAERACFGSQALPCAIASGQATVTMVETTGRSPGETVTGTGIPTGTTILFVNSPSQITLSKNATVTNPAVSLTFTRDVAPSYLGTAGANGIYTAILPPKKPAYVLTGTFDAMTDFFTPQGPSDFADGDMVFVEDLAGLPPELLEHFPYLVVNKTGPSFQIRAVGIDPTPVNFSTSGLGKVLLPDRQTKGLARSDYPQGHGIGTFTLTKAGLLTFAGGLADGTAVTASSALTEFEPWSDVALYASLYGSKGFLSGYVSVDNTQTASDMSASEMKWLRPLQSTSHYYPAGWPEVIKVELMAARYLLTSNQSALKAPDGIDGDSLGDNIQVADADGNASLLFSEGLLSEVLQKRVNVSTADLITKLPDNDPTYTLTINRTTGAISGSFDHTDDTRPLFNGILYQKGPSAGGHGFFLTKQPLVIDYTGESGSVRLIGQP